MITWTFRNLFCLFAVSFWLIVAAGQLYAQEGGDAVPDPCSDLLAIVGRPTVSDSPCAVPFGQAVVEMGFQYSKLRGPGNGKAYNYPQAAVRLGLPEKNEFVLIPPNYNRQRTDDFSGAEADDSEGLSAVTVGFKRELGYTRKWLGAVEALVTLPSGGSQFGSRGFGIALNGIAAYTLSEQIGLSLQLGVSSQTEPELSGGGRFTSLNSNIVGTWLPIERLQVFAEIYGQTSAGPGAGAGYNMDGGLIYLITRFWTVDIEEGVRLTGNLGGFTHYFGVGTAFLF